jgi:AcrR family transcriptional regulator
MPSHSSIAPRRMPQQKRGYRRVAGFLRAAEAVFGEMGYELATMNAIADRAHSCIGSLYQFFPNKAALADAIRERYTHEIEQSWVALSREATALSTEKLARHLVTLHLEIVRTRPALLALLDVPPTPRTTTRRELIRGRIATVLIAHKPRLSKTTALRIASVVQHVSRGLLALYAKADSDQKPAIVEEFRAVLSGYLVPKLR